MWRDRVRRAPDGLALVCAGVTLHAGELDARANRLAHHLLALGVGHEDVVAVALPRSPDMVVSLLAAWKCGAAYLPVDLRYPPDRVAFLLADAAPRAVVTVPDFDTGTVPRVLLDEATGPDTDPDIEVAPLAAAYIGYTSGSTGRPKGVVGTHAALARRVAWACELWPSGPSGARLAKSSFTFIDGTTEILEALAAGEWVVLADDREATDATALAELIRKHGIAHLMAVPGMLEALAAAAPDALSGMARVISTGEALSAPVARALYDRVPGLALVNSYGCSETTGDVLAGPVPRDGLDRGRVPAGTPTPGSRCHVLDRDLTPVPVGVVGELYVGGDQLTRGYLRRPALTAARFVADPFVPGERLYRTGDLARRTADGQFELLGRSDHQVKIRGHRVEPGETAAALRALPGVSDAVVVPREGPNGAVQLVGYAAGVGLDEAALRDRLAATLPDHFVPAAVVVLDALPRLPNGKLDRAALPTSGTTEATAPGRAPRDARDAALCALVAELLGRESVGIDDDFFGLGGDSLLVITLAGRAGELGLRFAASDVFEHPTVAQLVDAFALPAPSTDEPTT